MLQRSGFIFGGYVGRGKKDDWLEVFVGAAHVISFDVICVFSLSSNPLRITEKKLFSTVAGKMNISSNLLVLKTVILTLFDLINLIFIAIIIILYLAPLSSKYNFMLI